MNFRMIYENGIRGDIFQNLEVGWQKKNNKKTNTKSYVNINQHFPQSYKSDKKKY